MSDRWTKGPWTIHAIEGEKAARIGADGRNGGMYVANLVGPHFMDNAHLISAAPDMAEALDRLVSPQHGHNPGCDCPWCFARAALAKARGQA